MRKILSLVLAFALVLGCFPVAFADAATSGAQLQEWKIVQGDLDAAGKLTREMAITYYIRVLGEEAAALAFADATKFTDVPAAHWAAKYIAYAEAKGYTNGVGNGKFGLGEQATTQQMLAFMLRGLGYGDVAYADTVAKATELKLTTNVTAAAGDKIDRAVGFELLMNTLNTAKKGETTALKYVLKLAALPTVDLKVKSVSVVNGTVVDVALEEAVTAADVTTATISAKDAKDVALEVKGTELSADGKTVTVTTAVQTTAAKYVLTVGKSTYDFIGGVADTKAPSAISATPVDNTTVEVTFTDESSRLDLASAQNVANYTIAGLTVTAAELDGKVVTLTTSAQTSGTVYTVSVNGVKDVAGNAITSAKTATFAGKIADTAAPSAITVTPYSNTQVIVLFTDASNIDAGTAETIANYTFDKGLTVTSAMLVASDDAATLYGTTKNKAVVVTTSAQVNGTVYTVSVNGVADVKGNAIKTAKTATFAGKAADTAAPSAIAVTPYSNTQILVTFTDASNIDATTAAVAANFTIDKDLAVVSSSLITKAADATKYGVTANKAVLVTTAAQATGTVYTVSVKGVADVAGNAITTAKTGTFAGKAADTSKPTLVSATAGASNTVTLVFADASLLDEATVKTLTNYSFNNSLGYPLSVKTWTASTKTLVLNTAAQKNGTVYTVTVNNIKDAAGNTMATDAKATFAGIGAALDAPALSSVTALNNTQIKVVFNKEVTGVEITDFELFKGSEVADTLAGNANEAVFAYSDTEYIIYLGDNAADKLLSDVYKLKVVGTVTDLGGTNLDTATASKAEASFGGIESAPTTPQVTAISHVSSKQVELTFNQEMATANLAAASNVQVTYDLVTIDLGGTAAATYAKVTGTDGNKVLLTFASAIAADKVATLTIKAADFGKFTDVTGKVAMVKNDTTNYVLNFGSVAYSASTLKVSSVTGVDEQTLEIKFNQPINFTTNNNPGAGTDADFLVIKNDSTGVAITGYDLKYAVKEGTDAIRVHFTPGSNFADGTVYRVEFTDGAAGDALVTTIDAVALDASTLANASGIFGYNSSENVAPYLVSAVPLSATVVQLTFSESLSIAPTTDLTAATAIKFYNGSTEIAHGKLTDAVDTGSTLKVFTVTLTDGVFAAGTSYTVKMPNGLTITDKYGVDTVKKASATDADLNAVTFGGVGAAIAAPTATLTNATTITLNVAPVGYEIFYVIGGTVADKATVLAGTQVANAATLADTDVTNGQIITLVTRDSAKNTSSVVSYVVTEAVAGTVTAVTLQ